MRGKEASSSLPTLAVPAMHPSRDQVEAGSVCRELSLSFLHSTGQGGQNPGPKPPGLHSGAQDWHGRPPVSYVHSFQKGQESADSLSRGCCEGMRGQGRHPAVQQASASAVLEPLLQALTEAGGSRGSCRGALPSGVARRIITLSSTWVARQLDLTHGYLLNTSCILQ